MDVTRAFGPLSTVRKLCRTMLATVFERRSGTLVYIARTTGFALTVTSALGAVIYGLGGEASGAEAKLSIAMIPVITLVMAPLFENLCLFGFIHFLLALSLTPPRIVPIVSGVMGLLHWGAGGSARAVTGAVLFAVMAFTYFTRSDRSVGQRYLITVAQHTLFNAPATLLLVWGFGD